MERMKPLWTEKPELIPLFFVYTVIVINLILYIFFVT